MLVKALVYSPAALPSTTRAAPAKKRRLSTLNSTSKSATPLGLPTFCCSSFDSSAAWLLDRVGERVEHRAALAGRRLGPALEGSAGGVDGAVDVSLVAFGTSAITSSVAGLITSIVSPLAASAQSPSMNIWLRVAAIVTRTTSTRFCCTDFHRFYPPRQRIPCRCPGSTRDSASARVPPLRRHDHARRLPGGGRQVMNSRRTMPPAVPSWCASSGPARSSHALRSTRAAFCGVPRKRQLTSKRRPGSVVLRARTAERGQERP